MISEYAESLFVLTPIAVFAFKRPAHTRRALESLAQNPEFIESPLYIFCDGARHDAELEEVQATRQLARDWSHPNKTVIDQYHNIGLANSVIQGVTQICGRYGRVIVVEDDLVVSPVFLNYLNTALSLYENEPRVMQISAHMFPIKLHAQTDAVMLPFTTSWGWATWDRAWRQFDPNMSGFEKLKIDAVLRHRFDLNNSYPYYRMLKRQMNNEIDSWAIRWYLSVFGMNGLVLYPCHSLVRNDGFGPGATHTLVNYSCECVELNQCIISSYPKCEVQPDVARSIYQYLKSESSVLSKAIYRLLLYYRGGRRR